MGTNYLKLEWICPQNGNAVLKDCKRYPVKTKKMRYLLYYNYLNKTAVHNDTNHLPTTAKPVLPYRRTTVRRGGREGVPHCGEGVADTLDQSFLSLHLVLSNRKNAGACLSRGTCKRWITATTRPPPHRLLKKYKNTNPRTSINSTC